MRFVAVVPTAALLPSSIHSVVDKVAGNVFFFSSKSKKSPEMDVAFGLAREIPPFPVTAVACKLCKSSSLCINLNRQQSHSPMAAMN